MWNFDHVLENKWYKEGNVLPDLRMSLDRDPDLSILLITGWYDLLVPCFIPKFLLLHGLTQKKLNQQVQSVTTPAGHMVFVDHASHLFLANHLKQWVYKIISGS